MAQLAPQGVKGERGKVLAGKKVQELSLITAGVKCREQMVSNASNKPINPSKLKITLDYRDLLD